MKNNMKHKPDRRVEIYLDALIYSGGSNFAEYYAQPSSFKKTWETGYPVLAEMFGGVKEYVALPVMSCPVISYGHLGCIGAKINYPEDGEPNMEKMVDSVEEGIKWLERGHDFSGSPLFRFYEVYHQKIKDDFPGRGIAFGGLGHQGPITSAVLMRGQDFYIDLFEKPEESKKFLQLMTRSIIEYILFLRKINNVAATDPTDVGLCDDFAALISPNMFETFVTPYWNQYYEGLTATGSRTLHCEGMSRTHLQYLEKSKISYFQPSVSPLLTCQMLAEDLNIPYDWMLTGWELAGMDSAQIKQWVYDTAAVGAPLIRTQAGRYLLENYGAEKVYDFLNAFENDDERNG